MGRRDDARCDAMIHEHTLRATGVLEPDEPTAYSHGVWMRNYYEQARGEFTPEERETIRMALGLGPFAQDGDRG